MPRPPSNARYTFVLLPGMDGTGRLFARFTAQLPRDWDVRIVHYPPTRPLGYQALADIVRDALPMDRPYALLAESFSGPLGITVAAQAPPGLERLVLCCTFASNPRPTLRALKPVLPLLPLDRLPVAPLARLLMGRDFDVSLQAALTDSLAQLPAAVLRSRLEAVLDIDVRPLLPRIRVPTLCLQASRDRCVPSGCAKALTQRLPDSELVTVDGPHFLLQTKPTQAAAAVKRFLGSDGAGPRAGDRPTA